MSDKKDPLYTFLQKANQHMDSVEKAIQKTGEKIDGLYSLLSQSIAFNNNSSINKSITKLKVSNRQFFKQGKIWTLTFSDKTIPLQDCAGMKYIKMLLSEPGKKLTVHDLDMTNPVRDHTSDKQKSKILDKATRIRLSKRITELKELIADAENDNDIGAKEKYTEELFKSQDQLSSVVKNEVTVRQESISKAIERSIKEIDKVHNHLASHLRAFVDTKGGFSYAPDDKNINWQTTP